MRHRHVHLDFHTSEAIEGIGVAFDPRRFQDMLELGRVSSINLFAKCHHGWHYHDTRVGRRHPHLGFDLLKAQVEACRAIDVLTPIYLSVGLDEQAYWREPGWAIRGPDNATAWNPGQTGAGYHLLCLNTAYRDLVMAEIGEVLRDFATDALWLDITGERPCWCAACVRERLDRGVDPNDEAAIRDQAHRTFLGFQDEVHQLVAELRPGVELMFNSCHAQWYAPDFLARCTRKEVESLPTGGWGYDHFPQSAAYLRGLGVDFVGMTGRFHHSWGEFGGYKLPAGMRYEAGLVTANGAAMSVGDQLHPDGAMDEATYALIGAGFAEIEAVEPWLAGARSLADVAVWVAPHPADFRSHAGEPNPLEGLCRMLLEGQVFFDLVDDIARLAGDRYRLLALPSTARLDPNTARAIRAFADAGGRVVALGHGGCQAVGGTQLLSFGCASQGPTGFDPTYLRPAEPLSPWRPADFVIYGPTLAFELDGGRALAHEVPPFFQRDLRHFCSHQHAPPRRKQAAPAIVAGPHGTWIGFDADAIYREKGQAAVREIFLRCVRRELGRAQVETSLPSAGRVTLLRQEQAGRDVLHLLYAVPIRRGEAFDVIEDLVPIADVAVAVKRQAAPSAVTLRPQGEPLDFAHADGYVHFTVPRVECRQVVELAD